MWRHLLVTMVHCHTWETYTTTFMRICKQKTNQKSVFIKVFTGCCHGDSLLSRRQLVVTAQNVCERNKSVVHHHINTHSLCLPPPHHHLLSRLHPSARHCWRFHGGPDLCLGVWPLWPKWPGTYAAVCAWWVLQHKILTEYSSTKRQKAKLLMCFSF